MQQLPDSAQLYASIGETAVDAIVTIDERGLIVTVNPAAEEMFGYSTDQMLGRNVSMLMPEPYSSAHDGYLSRYLNQGRRRIIGVGRNVTGRRRDGSTFPVHLAVGEMHVGGARMFTGVVRDISDLHEARAGLERERDYADAIVASLQDGLVVRGLNGRIERVNPRFCELTGYGPGELVGAEPPFPYWPRGGRDPLEVAEAAGGEVDFFFRRKNGDALAVIISVAPVIGADGSIIRYVETVKDMTARHEMEAALAVERDRAAGIIGALRDGLIAITAEGVVQEANDTFLALVGLERDQVLGLKGPPFPWHADPEEAGRAFEDVLALGGSADSEVLYRRLGGEPFPVRTSAAPLRDAEGRFAGIVATCRDIGPMRRAQRELREREAAQLRSDALLEAEREEKRLKSEFLAMISHELRTPLSSVLGYLELALADASDPQQRDLLEVALRNGERLSALVRDVMLLAQASAGRLLVEIDRVDLASLVRQAVVAARPAATARDVAIGADIKVSPVVEADAGRIGQVLDNFIANAIKFSAPGGRVQVTLDEGSGRTRISVRNAGPGIPEDEQGKVFDAFYRTAQARRDLVPGTGLGLAIVKAITEAHGGVVGVESAPGDGATFYVELPSATRARPSRRTPVSD